MMLKEKNVMEVMDVMMLVLVLDLGIKIPLILLVLIAPVILQ